jgi:hypothetical protein
VVKADAAAVPVIIGVGHGDVNEYVGKAVTAVVPFPYHFEAVTIVAKIDVGVPHKVTEVAVEPVFEKYPFELPVVELLLGKFKKAVFGNKLVLG